MNDEKKWTETVSFVSKAVVNIKGRTTASFIDTYPGSWQATGFIIDKKEGYIITNRHVAYPGPGSLKGILIDREEIELEVIYRDPTHDFAVLRFDPKELRAESVDKVEELKLFPEGAKVGTSIRVIGNDAGEKLQILSGTLARIDRNAPEYGEIFNDHNTFYIGAASSTSGGSSGSPVVDIEGRAVALNAGGAFFEASSFYLPVDRIVRAMDLIRKNEEVARGTIYTIFSFTDFTEIRRLGLTDEEEEEVREYAKSIGKTELNGMIKVKKCVKQLNKSKQKLKEDDILLKMNGKPIVDFVSMESITDECREIMNEYEKMGKESKKFQMYVKQNKMEGLMDFTNSDPKIFIKIIVRRDSELIEEFLEVDDLNALMPKEYYEIAAGSFHEVSYDIAADSQVPCGLVYCVPLLF